jgi:DNA invertase Pin-like site-specific DNA recombinase
MEVTTMKAVGYVRVSTEEQAKEGVSLDNQIAKIRAYAELNGMELIEVINDPGKSGKTLAREGVQKVLSMCQNREVSHVIVYKLDRLTRSTKDLLSLVEDVFKKNDVQFHSLNEKIDTTTAQGKFFLTLMGAMAQMERDQISERTRDAMQYKKTQGQRMGTPSLGLKVVNGEALEVVEEISTLKRIEELKNSGLALGKIAERMNTEGYKTKRGGSWYASTINYLVKNVIPQTKTA